MDKLFKIAIVQRRLTHYRVPLFEQLRNELAHRNINLTLLVGDATSSELLKGDGADIPWAKKMPTRYLFGNKLCWQPVHRYVENPDLVIVTQENALLANHLLLSLPRNYKLAFWGHGANMQSVNPQGFRERFKRWTTNRVDWWFAYTALSADLVQRTGFPVNRITVLNNAVDTSELQRHRHSVTQQETQTLRCQLGIAGQDPVGIYVGSLYAEKRLDFLVAAAKAIRSQIPGFHLLLVGDGPEREKVQAWCNSKPWMHWAGAKFGREKVLYLSIAQVMLNPGLVGLGILDSLHCIVPMLTTACGKHSPEIAYLEHGKNGLMTPSDQEAYTTACVQLLRDPAALQRLRDGCAASACEYTLENMIERFANGIEEALGARL